jgi:hypothetical protein
MMTRLPIHCFFMCIITRRVLDSESSSSSAAVIQYQLSPRGGFSIARRMATFCDWKGSTVSSLLVNFLVSDA